MISTYAYLDLEPCITAHIGHMSLAGIYDIVLIMFLMVMWMYSTDNVLMVMVMPVTLSMAVAGNNPKELDIHISFVGTCFFRVQLCLTQAHTPQRAAESEYCF